MIIPVRCFTCGKVIGHQWEVRLIAIQHKAFSGQRTWRAAPTSRQPAHAWRAAAQELVVTLVPAKFAPRNPEPVRVPLQTYLDLLQAEYSEGCVRSLRFFGMCFLLLKQPS